MSTFSILVLLVALFSRTGMGLYSKYALKSVDSFSFFFFTNLFVVIAVFPFVFQKIPSFFTLPTLLIFALLGCGVMQAVTGIVSNYAMHHAPVSIYSALSQLQNVWVLAISIFFLCEKLNLQAFLGVCLILLASFIVSGSLHIRKEVGIKPILLVILSSLTAAIVVVLDKLLVVTLDQLFYFFLMLLIPLIFLLPDFTRRHDFYIKQVRNHWSIYLITAAIFAANYYSLLSLYKLPDVPLSVAYPIRSIGAILAVAIAIPLFGENKNIQRKILATIIAVAGAIIVKLA